MRYPHELIASSPRRRWEIGMAVAVAIAITTTVAAPPASAHESTITWKNWAVRESANPGQCVRGEAFQNHSFRYQATLSYREHTNTVALPQVPGRQEPCANPWARPAYHIAQRFEMYKDGMSPPCIVSGDLRNTTLTEALYWSTSEDAWPLCNNGSTGGVGNNVWITMDTWHYVWGALGQNTWLEGSKRPATGHCHCP